MQQWSIENPGGEPVVIAGEDLVSALSRHREALLNIAFPGGIEAMDTAWMHWNPNLFGGEGGIEIAVTGRHGGAERRGLIAIHATPSEMAPGTGRAVFF